MYLLLRVDAGLYELAFLPPFLLMHLADVRSFMQRGMSSYTMPEWVQRKMVREGIPLVPNAEFRAEPVTGSVGVFCIKDIAKGTPLIFTNTVLADVFCRQRNLPADYMARSVLPSPAQLNEQEEEQPVPLYPRVHMGAQHAEFVTTPPETTPQFAHMDSSMNTTSTHYVVSAPLHESMSKTD